MFDDLFGKPSKRQRKQQRRETLGANKLRGQLGESLVAMNHALRGEDVERTGRGSDFRVRKRDPLTDKVTSSRLVEVKTGRAKTSKLQNKTKKKKSNYSVERPDRFW